MIAAFAPIAGPVTDPLLDLGAVISATTSIGALIGATVGAVLYRGNWEQTTRLAGQFGLAGGWLGLLVLLPDRLLAAVGAA